MHRWLLTLILLAALPRWAAADAKSDAEAKRLWQEGTNAYSLGEFEEAIKSYKAAYKQKADPIFLYNIAQAYRLSKDFEQSLFFYKSYLRNVPKAPNRVEVEQRIAELERQQQVVSKPPNDPVGPTGDPGPTPTEPTDEPTTIPSVESVAEGSETGEEVASAPAPAPIDGAGRSRPIYKKWWFWAGVGVVAVGATVAIVAASGGGVGSGPESEFGSTKIF